MANEIVKMLKDAGLQVWMRKPEDEYCFVTDGTRIAYVQWSDYRTSVSTVHMPNKYTGTGFGMFDEITPENVRRAMVTVAPAWARDVQSVKKYKNWASYHSADSWNSGLVEV